jgi:hypothetical protein
VRRSWISHHNERLGGLTSLILTLADQAGSGEGESVQVVIAEHLPAGVLVSQAFDAEPCCDSQLHQCDLPMGESDDEVVAAGDQRCLVCQAQKGGGESSPCTTSDCVTADQDA